MTLPDSERENKTAWSLASTRQLGETEESGNRFSFVCDVPPLQSMVSQGKDPGRMQSWREASGTCSWQTGLRLTTFHGAGPQLPGSLLDLIWSYLHFQVHLEPKALLLPWVCPQQTWIHLRSFLIFLTWCRNGQRSTARRVVNSGFINHILFLNQQNSAFEGGPSFLFLFFFIFLPNPGQKPSFRVRRDVHDCVKSQEPLLKTATGVCKQVTETPSSPIPPRLSKLPLKYSQLLSA